LIFLLLQVVVQVAELPEAVVVLVECVVQLPAPEVQDHLNLVCIFSMASTIPSQSVQEEQAQHLAITCAEQTDQTVLLTL
jgi:hypothetical protein